ncbi:hypothetical protein H072_6272 [Dactylellina haptotyla CBS 200.50]|uniref:Glycosyltransferase family 62 protein n=1 Tax=Dactylellina haptotyla (strain CBS 200.50) TaxID=1284197 RepID=S8AAJ7_DACHA|nr:hypothetical protein H072_6272 [Dactylellina haptotyla CBS 200.50]
MVSPGKLTRPAWSALLVLCFFGVLLIVQAPVSVNYDENGDISISKSGRNRLVSYQTIQLPNASVRRVFTSKVDPPNPSEQQILLLTLTNDLSSWGRMEVYYHRNWTFTDYIARIRKQNLPPGQISLGLLTTSEEAFDEYTSDIMALKEPMPWTSAEIIYIPELPLPADHVDVNADDKPDKTLKHQWHHRRYLARLRNYLTSITLKSYHRHIVWLDPDVWQIPEGLFNRFVKIGNIFPDTDITPMVRAGLPASTPGKEIKALPPGLITLRSENFDNDDYDRNSWNGYGKRPSSWELNQILKKDRKFPGMENWAKSILQLLGGTTNQDLVKLDSVGASALYIRAELVREGLIFPPYPAVGTEWDKSGKDGVETEGLCYVAQRMGWGCYALGGRWHTKHSDS